MEVEWVRDTSYQDSWDLVRGDTILAYTMRPRRLNILMWCRINGALKKAPSQDVEEAKVIIQAMVLLEG